MNMREWTTKLDEAACQVFERTGKLMPMWHAIDGEGKECVFPMPSLCDEDVALDIVRIVLAGLECTRVAFIGESWSFEGDEANSREAVRYHAEHGTLEGHPGAMDLVVYVIEDLTEGVLMAQRRITRFADNPPSLGPLVFQDSDGIAAGRAVGMLPRPKRGRMN